MVGSIRLFVEAPLHAGAAVAASDNQAHYLTRVMRRGAGDGVVLFNGRDGEWAACIGRAGRAGCVLTIGERLRPQAAEPDLWLLFAPLKRDAMELVVEKATELGASRVYPVLTARANPARPNPERLLAIATEAAEQCERLSVPVIAPLVPLHAALSGWPAQRPLVVAMERQGAPPVPAITGPAALLVGPEGGFTGAELDVLRRAPFVTAASLGPRILRAETAAIAGLSLLRAGAID